VAAPPTSRESAAPRNRQPAVIGRGHPANDHPESSPPGLAPPPPQASEGRRRPEKPCNGDRPPLGRCGRRAQPLRADPVAGPSATRRTDGRVRRPRRGAGPRRRWGWPGSSAWRLSRKPDALRKIRAPFEKFCRASKPAIASWASPTRTGHSSGVIHAAAAGVYTAALGRPEAAPCLFRAGLARAVRVLTLTCAAPR